MTEPPFDRAAFDLTFTADSRTCAADIKLTSDIEASGSITVDQPEAYRRLLGLEGPLFTVQCTYDLNPHRRRARGWRERWRKLRDVFTWEWRRATRNPQPEEATMTLYDVTIR